MSRDKTALKAYRRVGRATLWLALAAWCSGCARGAQRPHAPRPGFQAGASTLGADLRSAPRGDTIPPPSLGVDLVQFSGPVAP